MQAVQLSTLKSLTVEALTIRRDLTTLGKRGSLTESEWTQVRADMADIAALLRMIQERAGKP